MIEKRYDFFENFRIYYGLLKSQKTFDRKTDEWVLYLVYHVWNISIAEYDNIL